MAEKNIAREQRPKPQAMLGPSAEEKALCEVIAKIKSAEEAQIFLLDLCTPKEIEGMAGRWQAALLLSEGLSYREIYEQTGVSTATVTRVARSLARGAGGYRLLLERLQKLNIRGNK